MKRPRIARISMTLPADLLRQTDQEVRRLGRSRSWVIAEALRRGLPLAGESPAERAPVVREPVVAPYRETSPRLDPQRVHQLRRDLALTPEARLRASDDAVRLGNLAHPRAPLQRVIFFDRFEEYLRWKDFGRLA